MLALIARLATSPRTRAYRAQCAAEAIEYEAARTTSLRSRVQARHEAAMAARA